MLQISKRSQYGLYFLIALASASKKSPVSIMYISQQLNLPYRFLSQIAGDLKAARIIKSKEGIKGGYYLSKKIEEISLLKIVETLDGNLGLIDCQLDKVCDSAESCNLRKIWDKARDEVELVLKKYKLSDFV